MRFRLYWVGLYEKRPGKDWFFRVDLAPAFGHSAKYLSGGGEHTGSLAAHPGAVFTGTNKRTVVRVLAATLAFLRDMLVFHPFISLFLLGVCLRLARYLPVWGAAIVSIGLTLPTVIIVMGFIVRATSGRSY